jgi:arylsulfatase
VLAALMVGAAGGWLAASGALSSAFRAAGPPSETKPACAETTSAPCCEGAGRQAVFVAARGDDKTPAKGGKKPNILVIFGDDIGISNLSCYSDGLMGYVTPNIDRIAKEGLRFLHYYGEQSCTAGRAAFLTGQHGIRTGLTKVGFPGAPMGMSQLDPSVGGLLKNLGYATGQFGKNHVGDRNETLPTVNGFD